MEAYAAQTKRLVGIRSTIGRGPKPVTVADGTVVFAVPYGNTAGTLYGTITYANGASLIGVVGDGTGVYTADEFSGLSEFRGWVWGAASSSPVPMTGIFDFKNGESFTGSYLTGTNAIGIYSSNDGNRLFVGEIDFQGGAIRPIKGIMQDRRGHLLALVL